MAFNGAVEYIPDKNGTAEKVKCPLIDDWIENIDCLENQDVAKNRIIEHSLPERFKQKSTWRDICTTCPFSDY